MKLVHQINLAFGLALALILAITAVIVHYVLLDHFVGAQKDDLRTLSSAMSSTLRITSADTGAQAIEVKRYLASAGYSGVEAIVADSQGNIVSSTTPLGTSAAVPFVTELTRKPIYEFRASQAQIVDSAAGQYVVEVSPIPAGTLTLLSPMSKIRAIEQALLGRLVLILFAVGAVLYLLSLFMTRKLIQPLMLLREELRKVKGRQFMEVRLVKGGGEIGAVAQTVYEMAGELNRASVAQKQFFQNASHELKTPLMSIAGYAEGIRDGVFEGDSARKGLEIILDESGRLTRLVTEMTLLAKLDSEEDIFRPAPVGAAELLKETAERINPLLVRRGLTLHLQGEDETATIVKADPEKLLQALLNVAANAARYARGHIWLTARRENGELVLTVADDGPGFPEELLPSLFHRFVKGKDGESGLGLAIARAIVERGGGTIGAANRREGGALIAMRFQAAEE
ncbi:sensor histidine kinase [Paenibacillus methanolicus]|uniref:histidine kinase n=1 Tax=Paenibacillus methanolicus TaxID=582686 RepID=A0A5S5C5I9_9BACL|nr:HAMP domain-containing sensor histidine kinase [Paenibacillus methanolicus]TYP74701.1 signal transduction histidine kinase [Paenibacillus methanolicus]